MYFKNGIFWSRGGSLPDNQDSLMLEHVSCRRGEVVMGAVCDGIGSLKGSEDAGAIVVSSLSDWFYREAKRHIREGDPASLILLSLQKESGEIAERLLEHQKRTGILIGTTCSALFIAGRRYILMHIGDSRIYRITKSENPIKILKNDKYNEELMTVDDVDSKGGLKKAFGPDMGDRPYFDTGLIVKNSVFLICSDGFYHGNDGRLARVLGPLLNEPADASKRLVSLGENAKARGSRDNMSAVAIVMHGV